MMMYQRLHDRRELPDRLTAIGQKPGERQDNQNFGEFGWLHRKQ